MWVHDWKWRLISFINPDIKQPVALHNDEEKQYDSPAGKLVLLALINKSCRHSICIMEYYDIILQNSLRRLQQYYTSSHPLIINHSYLTMKTVHLAHNGFFEYSFKRPLSLLPVASVKASLFGAHFKYEPVDWGQSHWKTMTLAERQANFGTWRNHLSLQAGAEGSDGEKVGATVKNRKSFSFAGIPL